MTMTTATYKIEIRDRKTDLAFRADWREARAPIQTLSEDGEWIDSGHQVTEARHEPGRAAALVFRAELGGLADSEWNFFFVEVQA